MTAAVRVDWSGPGQAAAYGAFVDRHDWYPQLAADLVERADISSGETIVDLCCGSGAVTGAVLDRCDPAVVVAVDASFAMLDQARSRLDDARVCFARGPAQALTGMLAAGSVDVVLCSASMWDLPVPAVLNAVRDVLRPGGRLAFNALADPIGPDATAWSGLLVAAGLTPLRVDRTRYEMSAAAALDWRCLPTFFSGPAGLSYDQRRAWLSERDGPPQPVALDWQAVVATKDFPDRKYMLG